MISVVKARNCENPHNQISDLQSQSNSDGVNKLIHVNDHENQNEAPPQKLRNRCCPYDFDSSICKELDDRILCGFNRNIGRPNSKNKAIDLSEGCRLRGGRLECGYVNGPYTNPRRPPVWYNYGSVEDDEQNGGQPAEHDIDKDEKDSSPEMLDVKNKLKVTQRHDRPVTRCVEIQDRIVCRDM